MDANSISYRDFADRSPRERVARACAAVSAVAGRVLAHVEPQYEGLLHEAVAAMEHLAVGAAWPGADDLWSRLDRMHEELADRELPRRFAGTVAGMFAASGKDDRNQFHRAVNAYVAGAGSVAVTLSREEGADQVQATRAANEAKAEAHRAIAALVQRLQQSSGSSGPPEVLSEPSWLPKWLAG